MPKPTPPRRGMRTTAVALTALAMLVAAPAGAQDGGSPAPSADPGPASLAPSLAPASPVFYPIPDTVLPLPADLPTVSLEPASMPSLTVGQPVPYALGHCGLLSPIDIDGSLWLPLGGTAADGGAIASDEAVGELINATEGELLLTSQGLATFTTAGGSAIYLERAPGAHDYALCM